jgi:hypothetical protein
MDLEPGLAFGRMFAVQEFADIIQMLNGRGKVQDPDGLWAVKIHKPLLPVCAVHHGSYCSGFLHLAAVDFHQCQELELLGTHFSGKIAQIPGMHLRPNPM